MTETKKTMGAENLVGLENSTTGEWCLFCDGNGTQFNAQKNVIEPCKHCSVPESGSLFDIPSSALWGDSG